MSCRKCNRIPEGAFRKRGVAIRTFKIVENSKVRVIYADTAPIELLIDGTVPPKDRDETSYFPLESGNRKLSLINRKREIIIEDDFEFKANTIYTIIVFQNHILQFEEENIVCPAPGFVRLQVYNMDRGVIDMTVDGDMVFQNLRNDTFMETLLETGVHVLRWIENGEELEADIELRNSNIYTLFLLKDTIFMVENAYCVNLI